MKRLLQLIGIRKWSGEDLVSLQAEPLKTIDAFFATYGNSIFNGCEVTPAADNAYNITPGFVALQGKDQDNRDTFKVAPFAGLENTALPVYLTLAYNVIEKEYVDGKVKPVAYDYHAAASSIRPEDGTPYLEITAAGGRRFIDAVGITQKLDKTGNGKDVTVTFAQATDRTNVQTGDKLTAILGKIARWFADLKAVAFSGKAADLTDDAAHRFATDTEKIAWNGKSPLVHNHTKSQITDFPTSLPASGGNADTVDGKHAADFQIAGSYAASTHNHTKSQITDFPASLPASDVFAWAKAATKPGYTAAEVGAAASGHNHAGVYQPAGSYAAATHNHTKSQITDFPASLPANGGNADTVDGLHAAAAGMVEGGKLASYNNSGYFDATIFRDTFPTQDAETVGLVCFKISQADGYHRFCSLARFKAVLGGLPASDVYAWAKAASKPAYTAAEVGAAASGHNHAGVYQPVGSYAAATHTHTASQITEQTNKRFMTDAERTKLSGLTPSIGVNAWATVKVTGGSASVVASGGAQMAINWPSASSACTISSSIDFTNHAVVITPHYAGSEYSVSIQVNKSNGFMVVAIRESQGLDEYKKVGFDIVVI